ncbi:hypothetical protein QJQ45_029351, partial [Haematococcus lacustris]
GKALVREAMASAAVVVWAAASCPALPPHRVAAHWAQGLFLSPRQQAAGMRVVADSPDAGEGGEQQQQQQQQQQEELGAGVGGWGEGEGRGGLGALEVELRAQGSSLGEEISRFSAVGKICALKGLVTAIPPSAMTYPLLLLPPQAAASDHCAVLRNVQGGRSEGGVAGSGVGEEGEGGSGGELLLPGQQFSFLLEGALAYACCQIESAPDSHFKFHAACVANTCMAQVLLYWQKAPASAVSSSQQQQQQQQQQQPGQGEGCVGGGLAPRLQPRDVQRVMRVLAAHLDEPLAQTLRQVQGIFEMLVEVLVLQGSAPAARPLPSPAPPSHQPGAAGSPAQAGCAAEAAGDRGPAGGSPGGDGTTAQPAGGVKAAATGCHLPVQQQAGQELDNMSGQAFLQEVAQQLLLVSYTRKGRYGRLAAVVQHLGAHQLLAMRPPLILETVLAMQEDMVASSAAHFLRTLLTRLLDECLAAEQQGQPGGVQDKTGRQAGEVEAAATPHQAAVPGPLQAPPTQRAGTGGAPGDTAALQRWRAAWLPVILSSLTSGSDKLRTYTTIHALPVVLALDPACLAMLLSALMGAPPAAPPSRDKARGATQQGPPGCLAADQVGAPGGPGGPCTPALVCVLQAARQAGLVSSLDTLAALQGASGHLHQLLLGAVESENEAVRVDCLELAATNPRLADAPGELELQICELWLSRCVRSTSPGQRNRCVAALARLFLRVKACSAALQTRLLQATQLQDARTASAAGPDQPPVSSEAAQLRRLQAFCHWVTRTMVAFLHPGAPYMRKLFAFEVLTVVLDAWPPVEPPAASLPRKARVRQMERIAKDQQRARHAEHGHPVSDNATGKVGDALPGTERKERSEDEVTVTTTALDATSFSPFCSGFMSGPVVQLLLVGAVDSWDKLRQGACSALLKLGSPLPGLATPAQLQPLLEWAQGLMWSPRLREADAGARMLRLMLAKYALGLHWHFQLGRPLRLQPPPLAPGTDHGGQEG